MREWSIIVILSGGMWRNCVRSTRPGISVFHFRALLDAWEESLAGVFYEFSPGMVSWPIERAWGFGRAALR
jgi:hypothetical protein